MADAQKQIDLLTRFAVRHEKLGDARRTFIDNAMRITEIPDELVRRYGHIVTAVVDKDDPTSMTVSVADRHYRVETTTGIRNEKFCAIVTFRRAKMERKPFEIAEVVLEESGLVRGGPDSGSPLDPFKPEWQFQTYCAAVIADMIVKDFETNDGGSPDTLERVDGEQDPPEAGTPA